MRTVILVPRREGKPERDATWRWVKAWWQRELGWEIFEGHDGGSLMFNRSAAINDAAANAGDWDAAVIIDADMICDPVRVRQAADLARASGKLVLPYNHRHDLSRAMSQRVQAGYAGSWKPGIERTHYDMCSGIISLSRRLWDRVGGFDTKFQGWGFEDNAFAAACETFSGAGTHRIQGEAWHLWHPTSTERGAAMHRNQAIADYYIAARGNVEATRAVQNGIPQVLGQQRIPRILHRVVPQRVDPVAERYWAKFKELHPRWVLKTWRDPIDPREFPLTSPKWGQAESGAQLADLVRLEAVLNYGGVYVDEDVQPFRALDPLLQVTAFAAWEDARVVPNAVFGATPWHPAMQEWMNAMLAKVPGPTWDASVGTMTAILPGRSDVLLLPPEAFYPVHYKDPERASKMSTFDSAKHPATFVMHRYAGSWLKKTAK